MPSGRVEMGQEIRRLNVVDAAEQEIWHHRREQGPRAVGARRYELAQSAVGPTAEFCHKEPLVSCSRAGNGAARREHVVDMLGEQAVSSHECGLIPRREGVEPSWARGSSTGRRSFSFASWARLNLSVRFTHELLRALLANTSSARLVAASSTEPYISWTITRNRSEPAEKASSRPSSVDNAWF